MGAASMVSADRRYCGAIDIPFIAAHGGRKTLVAFFSMKGAASTPLHPWLSHGALCFSRLRLAPLRFLAVAKPRVKGGGTRIREG